MYIADLHIHSRFSRATSRECDAPHLDWWARRKGISLLGTGDFTHPAWRGELAEQLVPAGQGVYALRKDLRLAGTAPGEAPRFVVTGEISCIYKRHGKTRKVHSLLLLPSLEAADKLSARLEAIGNIRSDGRPILGLDTRDLLELTLEVCPEAEFIPAHIWTPHFALFGAFSGFDAMEECFGDLTGHIHAVETGLSSDPPMNWRLSALDGLTLVSHSDAHSPAKLGREADLLAGEADYPSLVGAIRTGEGFLGTVEFFPEEGKYHLDGHRNCGVCLTPAETRERGGLCPVCGKKLTIGVEHRVEELADRPMGFRPEGARPFESLAPLPEVIASATGASAACKGTAALYERMLEELGPEFSILREVPIEDAERVAGPCVAEGLRRLRAGQVVRRPGFDGEYGVISLLTPGERQRLSGQESLFGAEPPAKRAGKAAVSRKKAPLRPAAAPDPVRSLNPEQRQAAQSPDPVTAVIAGPGTGKTGTLTERILHLVEERGAAPEEITAVTFTNQAAGELRARLRDRLGTRRAAKVHAGTFHALCLELLGTVRLVSQGDALELAGAVLRSQGDRRSPRALLEAVSQVKNGLSPEEAGLDPALFDAYCARLKELGALDLDDLLLEALKLDTAGQRRFRHLLVDEFQDVSGVQYDLVRAWSRGGESLFVIGDPDQAIYGFRGASGACFRRLLEDHPQALVVRLAENYRSTPEILAAALPVIRENPGGDRALRPNRPSGRPVRLVETGGGAQEGAWIAGEIARLAGGVDMLEAQSLDREREDRSFSDIAVLCRTRRQLAVIEKCLRRSDIPCVVSGRWDFLDAPEVRGPLAFFRWLLEPSDAAAREAAQNLCPLDALDQADLWRPLAAEEEPWRLIGRWEERWGASPELDKLRNMAVFHETFRSLWDALALGREADLRRAAGREGGRRWTSGAVRLMTIHAAKGLEFPAVFLAGLDKGLLPLEARGADPEEARRLLFVGLTRAREELILTTGPEPSPFLKSLPPSVTREAAPAREAAMDQLQLF